MLFWILFCICWIPLRLLFPTKKIGKKNLPKKKGYILTCNHYTNADAAILDVTLNKKIRFLAKKELFKKKFNAWFLKKIGGFPVNRERPEISTFKFAINTLKDDKILGIFPEGTRNKTTDDLQEIKTGAIVFASKADALIVPAVLYKRAKVFRRNYLLIGEPLEIIAEDKKRLTKEETEMNAERLAFAMNKLREDFEAKQKEKKGKRNAKKK